MLLVHPDNISYGAINAGKKTSSAPPKQPPPRFHHHAAAGYDTWVGERGVTLSGGKNKDWQLRAHY